MGGGSLAAPFADWSIAVTVEARPRPGLLIPLTGVGMIGLALARLVSGPVPAASGPWAAAPAGIAGVVLTLWGIRRLRRAKAARSGVSWWGLVKREVATLGVAAALLPAAVAVPQAERDEFVQVAREWFELIHVARGH